MSFQFRCYRLGCNPLSHESRLLSFGRFDKGTDRTKEVNEARNTIETERDKRLERTGALSDRLSAKRLNAPAIDPDRGQELLEAERETVLLGDMPDTPRYKALQHKVQKLEKICASRKTIQGIQFGFSGQEFTLISADEDFVQKALLHVAEEISELRRPDDRPELRLPQAPGEPDEDYAERIKAVEKSGRTAKELGRNRKNEDAEQWSILYGALRKYKSEFDGFKQILASLDKDPRAINKVSEKWRKENPASYTKALKDAAMKDATVLGGKEKQFSVEVFAGIIGEAKEVNPKVLAYLPTSVKEKDTEGYRREMIAAAENDGSVLLLAAAEYDKYWGILPYEELSINALNQNPQLFFQQYAWLKPNTSENLRTLTEKLSLDTKIAIVEKAYDVRAFSRLEGGYAGFINSMLSTVEADRTLIAVGSNEMFWNKIQAEDPALHFRLKQAISASKNPDVRALLRKDYIGGNEKIGKTILSDLAVEMIKPGADIAAILRERESELSGLSSEAWRGNEAAAMLLFKNQGELFRFAPEWMRDDKEIVMKVLKLNAGAYQYVSERLRNDPEVLYRALLSDQKGQGDFYWKNVGPSLKRVLPLIGLTGIPSPGDLLRVLILGVGKESAPLTKASIDSLIDDWTDEMKSDAKLVGPYLLRHPEHPEYILDAGLLLQMDIDFVTEITQRIPGAFAYIDHAALYKDFPKKYLDLAAKFSTVHIDMFQKIPEAMRTDKTFIAEISKRIPAKKPGSKPRPDVPEGEL